MATAWTPVPVPGRNAPAKKVRTAAAPRMRGNTLQRLRASRVLLLALDSLLLVVLLSAVRLAHDAMKTVGQDAAPSIIAAQHIKTAMAGMDANLANELLTTPDSGAPSLSNYDAQRTEAATSLVTAAENITYGESERGPIRTLETGLAVYEDLAERARDLHDAEKAGDAAGGEAVLQAYRQAETMTDRSLLPAADDLDAANLTELEKTYSRELTESTIARSFIGVIGLLTLAAFVGLQGFLSRHTRRTFNPALLGATVLTLGLLLYMFGALTRAQRELRVAKEDAFTSVHALWQARATAYQAHSEESRFLLDPGNAAAHQGAFQAEASALAQAPLSLSGAELVAALRERTDVDGFSGHLADELKNITFAGEREAALDSLEAWLQYLEVDARIRNLEHARRHQEAIELCTGTTEGGADWALARFDKALGRTLAINQSAFDRAVRNGTDALSNLDVKAASVALIVAVLVFVGLAPRIREYQ